MAPTPEGVQIISARLDKVRTRPTVTRRHPSTASLLRASMLCSAKVGSSCDAARDGNHAPKTDVATPSMKEVIAYWMRKTAGVEVDMKP